MGRYGVLVGLDGCWWVVMGWWWLATCVRGSVRSVAESRRVAGAQTRVLVGLNGFWWVERGSWWV